MRSSIISYSKAPNKKVLDLPLFSAKTLYLKSNCNSNISKINNERSSSKDSSDSGLSSIKKNIDLVDLNESFNSLKQDQEYLNNYRPTLIIEILERKFKNKEKVSKCIEIQYNLDTDKPLEIIPRRSTREVKVKFKKDMIIKDNYSNDGLLKENAYNTSKSLTNRNLVIKSKNKLELLEPNKYMPLSTYSCKSKKEIKS
jgi:hypothetical protein